MVAVPANRRGRAWAKWLLVLLMGCALETNPELSGANRQAGIPRIPDRSPSVDTSDPIFGPMATPEQPMMTPSTGGLQCNGVFCPFTPDPLEPCCTTQDDVDRYSALFVDRCGVDFSAAQDPARGTACWQRDQLGPVDDMCPSRPLLSGGEEIGCCSNGFCGSFDTGSGLGCHYELDEAPFPCQTQVVDNTVKCEPLGVFGVVAKVDVSWGGRSGGLVGLTDDGRGSIDVYLRVTVKSLSSTNEMSGIIEPCGVTLPPFFSTTLCESYNPIFPQAMWNAPDMPTFPLLGRYTCPGGSNTVTPGCTMTLDAQTTLLGIALDNPEAPWPTPAQTPTIHCMAGTGVDCFVDQDSDQLPGLTIELNTQGMPNAGKQCSGRDYVYNAAPLSADLATIFGAAPRADRVLLGVRNKLGGSGVIAGDCNSGVGSGVAEFFESRAWGCVKKEGSGEIPGVQQGAGPNEACNAAEATFMDENLPIYYVLGPGEPPASNLDLVNDSVSSGPYFGMVRLGGVDDSISCDQVRDAPYP